MTDMTPDEFEVSIVKIASLVLAPDSMPGQIINSDKPNESEIWDEDLDKANSNAAIEGYLDDVEAGINSLTKAQKSAAS